MMRALQVIVFVSFILGYGGIEDQAHNMQPVAVVLMFAAAIALLIMAKREERRKGR